MNPFTNWLALFADDSAAVLLLSLVAKLTLIMAAAWIAHAAFARTNPRWRVLLWRLAAAGCVLVVALAACPPLIQWAVLPSDRAGGQVDAPPPSFNQEPTATAPHTNEPTASFNPELPATDSFDHEPAATEATFVRAAVTATHERSVQSTAKRSRPGNHGRERAVCSLVAGRG